MARLFGREWPRRELQERVGDLSQVAGVERFTYDEGVATGVKAARVRTGGGLDFNVLFSRGMDIAQASYNGVPLAWVSSTGAAHPHALEPEGRGWLRTFHGGLLTGCGLMNAGAAHLDENAPGGPEPLGIHGYLSHSPAESTYAGVEWDGDEATLVVQGTTREARVFAENVRLTRRITAPLGGASLTIRDTVENLGFQSVPLMLLYHLNFGWPLVSEDTDIVYRAARAHEPRDADAAPGMGTALKLEAPTPGYAEQCFFHEPEPDKDGVAHVLMANRARNLAVQVSYDKTALPHLTQWKMMGRGEYVCGIEPANCRVYGRMTERAEGRLQQIEPGETRAFAVTLTLLDGPDAITTAERSLG